MYEHLLIGVDGSGRAEAASLVARDLAERLGSRITLLHVLEPHAPETVHGEPHLGTAEAAAEYLDSLRDRLGTKALRVDTLIRRATRDVAQEICGAAKESGADLIVLCAHGTRGVRGLLSGRIAQQVLARGEKPVLLLPVHARWSGAGRLDLIVPLGRGAEDAVVMNTAEPLAQALGARILLTHAVPTAGELPADRAAVSRLLPNAAEELLQEETAEASAFLDARVSALRAAGIDASAVIVRDDPVRALGRAAGTAGPALIVLATHARTGLAAWWEGSVGDRVVEAVDRPVLLVKAAGRG